MNIPKFLALKLGKERVAELAGKYKPLPECDIKKMNTHPNYHDKEYPTHVSKNRSQRKWRAIQNGYIPPDPLYSVDEALEKAGL
jgi:hypothetical protein